MEVHSVRTTKYYCPYCEKSQWLWSLKPISTDEWVCTKCQHPFLLDVKAIAHSWLNTITFWSMLPIATLLIAFFIVFVKADKLVWAILIGVPVFTVAFALLIYAVCIPIGLYVGARVRARNKKKSRLLKTVLRQVS
jgi:hypothetical protein